MKVRQASWNALHNISFSLSSHLFLFTAKSTSKLSILSLRLFSSAQVCAAWVDCHAIILVASVRWDGRVIRRVARQHLRLKLVSANTVLILWIMRSPQLIAFRSLSRVGSFERTNFTATLRHTKLQKARFSNFSKHHYLSSSLHWRLVGELFEFDLITETVSRSDCSIARCSSCSSAYNVTWFMKTGRSHGFRGNLLANCCPAAQLRMIRIGTDLNRR